MKQCPYCYHVLESEDLINLEKPKPNHCCCDPREWGFEIPPVCPSFHPMSEEEPDICRTCEHEKGCHRE